MVATEGLGSLVAPPVKITAPHTPVPAAPNLEQLYIPSAERSNRQSERPVHDPRFRSWSLD